MTVTTIFIIAISVLAAIGGIIGIFKKATGLTFWGATVVLGALIAQLVVKLLDKQSSSYSYLILGITIAAVVLLMLIFGWFRKFLEKRVSNAREYSHYKNLDKVEENEAYILNAVDSKNKRSYRKYRRKGRKIKDSAGGWGVVNRILGFIVGGIDWLVAFGFIICGLLIFVECCGIGSVQDHEVAKELLASNGWKNVGSKFALDILIIGSLVMTINAGFKKGIFRIITPIIVIAMLGAFGFSSWMIASSHACEGIVSSMQNGMLSPVTEVSADASAIVAKIIIAAVLFLLSLIIVIATGVLLPKLLRKFRENDAYYVIDGVFGAIVYAAILLAAILAVGGIAYTLNDLAFMAKFNSYETQSAFANAFYAFNPLNEVFVNLPIRGWFGN